MRIVLSDDVRALLDAPNYVHLSTLRQTAHREVGWCWAGIDGDRVLVCAPDLDVESQGHAAQPPSQPLRRGPGRPYRMAALQGRVVRFDGDCRYMVPIAVEYTNAPLPRRGPDRLCLVIAVENAYQRTRSFAHNPG